MSASDKAWIFCWLALFVIWRVIAEIRAGKYGLEKPTSNPVAGRLFDSHAQAYNLSNSQRYALMAEDAAEFGGSESARHYYFNSIDHQIIAGEGGLMSDDRCPADHPALGIRCDRKVWDCWGIDHFGMRESGLPKFWRNPHGSTVMHRFFEAWLNALQKATEESERDQE